MRSIINVSFVIFAGFYGQSLGLDIKWPDTYYFKAEKIDLIQGSVKTEEFWVNHTSGRYRLDVFNGTVKKYYDFGGTDPLLMIHYVVDKNMNPIIKCSTVTFDIPSDFLPGLSEFKITGEETIDGKIVRVCTHIDRDADPSNRLEEYLYLYEDNTPMKLIKKAFSENAGLRKYVVINYLNYTTNINVKDVALDRAIKDTCKPINSVDNLSEESIQHIDPNTHRDDVNSVFKRYKNHHNKIYGEEEHKMRMSIFQKNRKLVEEHNSKNLSYKLELNSFADLTPEELRHLTSIRTHKPTLGTHAFPYSEEELDEIVKELPREFDWRTEGIVSMVKSQGHCGSCWAFAATASIEGALSRLHGGRNLDLSEQSIVDCAWPYKVYGCEGGYTERAFQFVMEHGIPTEEEYGGYLENDGECHIKNVTEKYRIKGYVAVTPMSVNALKAAVYNNGPVAVYVYCSDEMHLYSHGIFYDSADYGTKINHVVVVVGYGVRDGAEYWIVKNSYGQRWGEDGYILISATNNSGNVLYAPYYPLV